MHQNAQFPPKTVSYFLGSLHSLLPYWTSRSQSTPSMQRIPPSPHLTPCSAPSPRLLFPLDPPLTAIVMQEKVFLIQTSHIWFFVTNLKLLALLVAGIGVPVFFFWGEVSYSLNSDLTYFGPKSYVWQGKPELMLRTNFSR